MSDSGKSRVKKPIMNKVPLPATTVVKQQSVPPPVVMQERFEEPRDKRKLIVKTEKEEMESQEQAEAAVKQEALLSVPPVVKQDAAMPVLPVVKKEARFEELRQESEIGEESEISTAADDWNQR